MTDPTKPSPAAIAAADAICTRHGMLPGGFMRDSLGEALDAFAAQAVKERVITADEQAERYERDLAEKDAEIAGLEHTLELWEQECGGVGPRAFVQAAVSAERERIINELGLPHNLAEALRAPGRQVATMLGQPIGMDDLKRISQDGP